MRKKVGIFYLLSRLSFLLEIDNHFYQFFYRPFLASRFFVRISQSRLKWKFAEDWHLTQYRALSFNYGWNVSYYYTSP